jgi:peptide/nickel transport system permease protein
MASVPALRPRPALPGWLARVRSGLGQVAATPSGKAGLTFVFLLVFVALFAPLLAPFGATERDLPHRLEGPSALHPLGTDDLGHDLLSQLMYGARIALEIGVPTILISLAIGIAIGLVAGYFGGKVDAVLVVIMDTAMAFPGLLLALAVISVLGPSLVNLVIVLVIGFAPGYGRIVRGSVLSAKQSLYVEAEQALGATGRRIVWVHLAPNIIAPLLVMFAMDMPVVITAEAGLSIIGLGVPPPSPSWGAMLSNGTTIVQDTVWPLIWSFSALTLTALGMTLLGERLQEINDPRLSGLSGRRLRRRARRQEELEELEDVGRLLGRTHGGGKDA